MVKWADANAGMFRTRPASRHRGHAAGGQEGGVAGGADSTRRPITATDHTSGEISSSRTARALRRGAQQCRRPLTSPRQAPALFTAGRSAPPAHACTDGSPHSDRATHASSRPHPLPKENIPTTDPLRVPPSSLLTHKSPPPPPRAHQRFPPAPHRHFPAPGRSPQPVPHMESPPTCSQAHSRAGEQGQRPTFPPLADTTPTSLQAGHNTPLLRASPHSLPHKYPSPRPRE